MSVLAKILDKAASRPGNLSEADLVLLLSLEDPSDLRLARDAAFRLKRVHCGNRISVRALVEMGNVCSKDCFYCGIRRSNADIPRYSLSADDVLRLATLSRKAGFASLVLQSGELESEAHSAFIEDCLRRIVPLDLGVTLSLGEQEEDVYRRWKAAGASRYLLRIESSSPELYRRIHPASHSWERRIECLRAIRRCGYQLGTGVMSALPGQSPADLARDILFFAEIDADMIGMGPYIPHPDTPLAASAPPLSDGERLRIGLNMITATRLFLHDVNIASTTALQSLAPDGRIQGILAGANVLMPNVTDLRFRPGYRLYAGKPALDEIGEQARRYLDLRLAEIGESILYNARGDSPHFFGRSRS